MNAPVVLQPSLRSAQPRVAHLAAACCYLGAAWIAVHDGVALSAPPWLTPALDFPWFAVGLALAGLWWVRVGMRDKGWVHLVAAVLFVLPKIYNLPTDMFGNTPAIVLTLAIGVYLHAVLWRDHARLRAANMLVNARGMVWLPVVVLLLLALHMLVAQFDASLKADFLALQ